MRVSLSSLFALLTLPNVFQLSFGASVNRQPNKTHVAPDKNEYNQNIDPLPPSFNTLHTFKKLSSPESTPTQGELEKLARNFDGIVPDAKKRDVLLSNGVIAVFSEEYGFMGYVGTSFTTFSTLPTTQDVTLVLFVTLPSVDPPGIFDMRAIGMPAPYLGVIDGYSGPLWGPGLAGYGSMTVVQESTFPASNVQNPTGLPSQSNIWTMDSTTGQLTSTWFNDDGTPVPCTMFYDLTYGDLNFGGDLSAFKATYWQDQDVQVWLYYIGLW